MQIEHLPNELFLALFSFIRPKDLLQGWYHLNSHINAILRSASISIEINNNDDFDNNLPYLQHFCSQIIYLRDNRLMPRSRLDLRSFTNIRYLYLAYCSKDQWEHLHPRNQPNLTRFFSLSPSSSVYERILFGEERFSNLISVGYPRGATIQLLHLPKSINRTLRHLHLYSASNDIISRLVEHFPHIISLSIEYFYSSNASSLSTTTSNVSCLTIKHMLSSQMDFDELLSSEQFAHLTKLRVAFNTCNFDQLAQTLTKLPCLRLLHLKIRTYPINVDVDTIRLQSPWFLTLYYGFLLNDKKIDRILIVKTERE